MGTTGFVTSAAQRRLSRDPVMRRLIRAHGPCALAPDRWSPYEALTRAVAHQQLHRRAAESILARFVALFDNGRFPSPADVAAARADRLRRAGFSRGKALAIKDIARHALAGTVPPRRAARGRLRRARGLPARVRTARASDAEGPARARRAVEALSLGCRLVPLARGERRAPQRQIVRRLT